MKTPAFWSEPNFLSRLLKPLGAAYAFATRLRIGLGRPCKIGRPVVCIGNLTAGGTGKTPVAVAIAGLLQQAGKNPFFVSKDLRISTASSESSFTCCFDSSMP